MYNIVIYPGSFDPFHHGHAHVIEQVQNDILNIDKFIVLIQHNCFKDTQMFTTEFNEKIINDYLIKNNKTTITVESTDMDYFDEWISLYLHYESLDNYDYYIYLVIGDDTLDTINKWHNFEHWKNKITYIVIQRNKSYEEIETLQMELDINCKIISHDSVSMKDTTSSTKIRKRISAILEDYV